MYAVRIVHNDVENENNDVEGVSERETESGDGLIWPGWWLESVDGERLPSLPLSSPRRRRLLFS